jgi:hypothetical protein
MGSFLDKPKVEHHCEEVKGNGLDAGLAAMQVGAGDLTVEGV